MKPKIEAVLTIKAKHFNQIKWFINQSFNVCEIFVRMSDPEDFQEFDSEDHADLLDMLYELDSIVINTSDLLERMNATDDLSVTIGEPFIFKIKEAADRVCKYLIAIRLMPSFKNESPELQEGIENSPVREMQAWANRVIGNNSPDLEANYDND